MRETELFEPVKKLLYDIGCNEVYGEIFTFDVVGLMASFDIIVEMKTSLNFKVIEQAFLATEYASYVYIAVPEPKNKSAHYFAKHHFLSKYRIGLIYVRDKKFGESKSLEAYVEMSAKINRSRNIKRFNGKSLLRRGITEFSKENIGGSKGGDSVTEYSFMISKIKEFLLNNGESTIDEILEGVPYISNHYADPKSSLRATLSEKWNTHWAEKRAVNGKGFVYKMIVNEKEVAE